MNACKVDGEQPPRKAFKGPIHPLRFAHEPHEHVVLHSALMATLSFREAGGQTGLSSQSSPNSSILAKRSSTIGLMNSVSCRTFDGRLDSMRATILNKARCSDTQA